MPQPKSRSVTPAPKVLSPFRATAVVGLGSAVSLIASVVAAKVLALAIGPDGVGRLGLTQSLLNIAVLMAGLGIATGVVRALAVARVEGDAATEGAIRRASELILIVVGIAGALILAGLRDPLAMVFLGSASRSGDVLFVGLALVMTLMSGVEMGIVNGYQRLGILTFTTALSAVLAQAIMIGFVLVGGAPGIAPALFAAAAASLILAIAARLRAVGFVRVGVDARRLRSASSALLRFGLPVTASALVGAGAQMAVPVLVLNQLGQGEVGLYRAAATVSVGYVSFTLAALVQDYYPRVAAAKPDELLDLIEQRMRLVMALAVPVILGMLALAPLVIRLLYTSSFAPATGVLDWQLAGDLLKLPAWTMAFVLLARGSTLRYFLVELLGGGTLIGGTWIATGLFGLPGAGIAYFASFAIYYLAMLWAVRRFAPATPGRLQLGNLGLVVLILVMFALPPGFETVRTGVFLVMALTVASLAWPACGASIDRG